MNLVNALHLWEMVDVTGIEPATPCLQSSGWKTLKCFDGVAYADNQQNSRSPIVPKLSRVLVPAKNSLHIEIVVFTERRPVVFPNHVHSTLLLRDCFRVRAVLQAED